MILLYQTIVKHVHHIGVSSFVVLKQSINVVRVKTVSSTLQIAQSATYIKIKKVFSSLKIGQIVRIGWRKTPSSTLQIGQSASCLKIKARDRVSTLTIKQTVKVEKKK